MADRKGIPHMRKKLIALSVAFLTISGSVLSIVRADAAPVGQPTGAYVGFSYSDSVLTQDPSFASVIFIIVKPGQSHLSAGDLLTWNSPYDLAIPSNWSANSTPIQVEYSDYEPPGSELAIDDFIYACRSEIPEWSFIQNLCVNGDYTIGDGLQVFYFRDDETHSHNHFTGQSEDIFTATHTSTTLPPDFLTPKTYGNPASVTGTAPAAPAVAITPTAPVITAGATSVIYNGVPQSATYSVDQKSSCSTTYNGSSIPPVTAGSYAVSITCTANSLTSTATTTLTITKATPVISWSTPGAITTATKLSSSQLNAFSYIPGSFTYSASAGSTLPAGDDLVTATFTPTDSTNYISATMTVTIKVTA